MHLTKLKQFILTDIVHTITRECTMSCLFLKISSLMLNCK